MLLPALRLILICLAGAAALGGKELLAGLEKGGQAQPVDFDPTVAAFFAKSTNPAEVRAWSSSQGKPIMAIVTMSGCGACIALKTSVNTGQAVKQLLPHFVVVNAADSAAPQWQKVGEGYVPQAHFFDPNGNPLAVLSANPQYKHYYPNDQTLAEGMQKAWWLLYGSGTGAPTAMVNVTGGAIGAVRAATNAGHPDDEQVLPCFVDPRTGFEDAPATLLGRGKGNSGRQQRHGNAPLQGQR